MSHSTLRSFWTQRLFLGVNLLSREGNSQTGDRMFAMVWLYLTLGITLVPTAIKKKMKGK